MGYGGLWRYMLFLTGLGDLSFTLPIGNVKAFRPQKSYSEEVSGCRYVSSCRWLRVGYGVMPIYWRIPVIFGRNKSPYYRKSTVFDNRGRSRVL
jgi:hypothetical protein